MEKMYRQGDLLFIQTNRLGEKCIRKHGLVVLGSKITGHDHAITAGTVYEHAPDWYDRANFYVHIPEEGANLIHPEHKTIALESGFYKVIRQREVNGYVAD